MNIAVICTDWCYGWLDSNWKYNIKLITKRWQSTDDFVQLKISRQLVNTIPTSICYITLDLYGLMKSMNLCYQNSDKPKEFKLQDKTTIK